MTTKAKSHTDRSRAVRLAVALVGLSVTLGACKTFDAPVVAAEPYPDDYRLRHPIAVQEADRSIVVFVGRGRGGLSASQRADVMYLGQTWMREGTGIITIDVPVSTPNARAAEDSLREIQATLAAAGVPPRATNIRQYRPEDPRHMAAIRLNYPKISAVAGPCGHGGAYATNLWINPDNKLVTVFMVQYAGVSGVTTDFGKARPAFEKAAADIYGK